nr:hypothetical protein [Lachnospiraceae bacterium]
GSRYACRHDRMVKFLDENDLTVGYSNLYNSANAVTILSDSRIMVSPIELNRDGSYNVYKYQSMADWYKKEAERYFVVVSNEEKEWTKEALLDNCIEELEFDEDTSVLVFDKNIFDENLGASFKSGGK